MRDVSLWRCLLGVEKTVIEAVEFDEDAEVLIASVRPTKRQRGRCGVCRRRSPGYDAGAGRRRWRALDLGMVAAVLEADAPRVSCREHGVVVAAVPWARHDAGHTYAFDETVAWLATQSSKSTVTELMRIAWRTVGSVITRVWDEIEAQHDRFAGLRRIGIDEISYKKGHKYLMVVVDHDTRRLVWAAPGRSSATVGEFFDLLGEERCAQITHVSADGADFIDAIVAKRCPAAVRVADPFPVVRWATHALDEVRRQAWTDARPRARHEPTRARGRPPADAPPRLGGRLRTGGTGARASAGAGGDRGRTASSRSSGTPDLGPAISISIPGSSISPRPSFPRPPGCPYRLGGSVNSTTTTWPAFASPVAPLGISTSWP